ncbi:Protein POLR1D, isoform [Dirofilaria immitis]
MDSQPSKTREYEECANIPAWYSVYVGFWILFDRDGESWCLSNWLRTQNIIKEKSNVCRETMKEAASPPKLCQLDKLIVKAKRNLNPVATQVKFSITQTNKRELSELEKKAREEILKDTALGVRRYEKIGPQGWKKPACLKTNKKFLERVLRSTQSKSNMIDK